ncbi:hypothetical protein LSAT2_010211 [Lamellibrachia satsuma]|nr:hypothetical protein LSAT2_010211 [Lamellibrachia satsuma]
MSPPAPVLLMMSLITLGEKEESKGGENEESRGNVREKAGKEKKDGRRKSVQQKEGYLNDRFMLDLGKEIGVDYRHFGIYLGLDVCSINAISRDESMVADCAFCVIKAWVRTCKKPDLVKVHDNLHQALSKIGREDLADLVRRGLLYTGDTRTTQSYYLYFLERRLSEQIRQMEARIRDLSEQLKRAENEKKICESKSKEEIRRLTEKANSLQENAKLLQQNNNDQHKGQPNKGNEFHVQLRL